MKKVNKNKRGFSVIELLLVIGIISIMAVSTSVFMNSVRKSVEVAAREVAGAVREAQNYALTGKNAGVGTGCAKYFFSWTAGSADYEITGEGAGCKIQEYALKNGVKFVNGGSFSFRIPFSFVEGSLPFPPSGYLDINLKRGGDCFHVSVFSSGIAKEEYYACP